MKIKEFENQIINMRGVTLAESAYSSGERKFFIDDFCGNAKIEIPYDATSWFEISTSGDPLSVFSKKQLNKLSKLITEFIETPVENRKNKWNLLLGHNEFGKEIYLAKSGNPRLIDTTMNLDCFSEWSDNEIDKLKKTFPTLDPVIDGMKVLAEEDK